MNPYKVVTLAVIALLIDMPWLYLNSEWSGKVIRAVQGSALTMRLWPAVIVYLAIGYLISTATTPLKAGAIGITTYAIYDFTNYATFKNYDPYFAITDTVWGGALFALTLSVAQKIGV